MHRSTTLLVVGLLTVSCSGTAGSTTLPTNTTSITATVPAPTTTDTPTTSGQTNTTTPTSTSTPATTIDVIGSTSTTLAGEPFDLGPRAGDILGVVGVAFGDVLNVRSGPGTDQPIVAQLDPMYAEILATGQHRLLTRSVWNEVTVDGISGWANSSFMAYLGTIDDATARYLANAFGGTTPSAATMLELGMLVADSAKSEDPPSRITVTVAPSTGDLGEVTIDVVGLGDDAVVGFRLHIFGQPGADGFSLKSIEEQVLCGRGITADGLCP